LPYHRCGTAKVQVGSRRTSDVQEKKRRKKKEKEKEKEEEEEEEKKKKKKKKGKGGVLVVCQSWAI
jgi:hypothetical protein